MSATFCGLKISIRKIFYAMGTVYFLLVLKNKDGNKDGNDVKSGTRIVVNTFICTYLPKERLRKKLLLNFSFLKQQLKPRFPTPFKMS